MLGYAYAMMGRLTDALPILERAVEHAHLNRTVEAGLRTYFAEACLLAADTRTLPRLPWAPWSCHGSVRNAASKRGSSISLPRSRRMAKP